MTLALILAVTFAWGATCGITLSHWIVATGQGVARRRRVAQIAAAANRQAAARCN